MNVRPIADSEIGDYMLCAATGFHGDRVFTDEHLTFWLERCQPLDRRLAGFDGDRVVSTAGAFPTTLSVPGGSEISLCAVTAVTVLPTHRRRGLLTSMMAMQLADALEREETAAMLIAAEWPIYGRFGYGMAIEAAGTHVDATTAAFIDPPSAGTLELVDSAGLRALAPAAFDAHRLSTHGSIGRGDVTWDLVTGVREQPGDDAKKSTVRVVHRDPAGTVDGYAIYVPTEIWERNRPNVKLDVHELITTNHDAYRDLWRYLCEVDWVTHVVGHTRAIDEPLRHLLTNGRATWQLDRSDFMWVRLLDIPAALTARGYDVPAHCTIDVVDPYLSRGGRFALDVGPAGSTCTPTTTEPDVVLGVDVLGAIYLGGTRLWELAHRTEERTPGTLKALDLAFATQHAPWCTTAF